LVASIINIVASISELGNGNNDIFTFIDHLVNGNIDIVAFVSDPCNSIIRSGKSINRSGTPINGLVAFINPSGSCINVM
jgi:hypothetical protein